MTNKTSFLDLPAEEQELHRESLEDKAKSLGMTVPAQLSTVKLYERIQAKLEEQKTGTEATEIDPNTVKLVPQSELDLPEELFDIADRLTLSQELVRVIVTPNDPIKRDWTAEVLDVANDAQPSTKKAIPFGEEFHIPRILYNALKEKQYLHSIIRKNPQTGKEERINRLVPAYSITLLDNLSPEEISAIAERQLATKRQLTN